MVRVRVGARVRARARVRVRVRLGLGDAEVDPWQRGPERAFVTRREQCVEARPIVSSISYISKTSRLG